MPDPLLPPPSTSSLNPELSGLNPGTFGGGHEPHECLACVICQAVDRCPTPEKCRAPFSLDNVFTGPPLPFANLPHGAKAKIECDDDHFGTVWLTINGILIKNKNNNE